MDLPHSEELPKQSMDTSPATTKADQAEAATDGLMTKDSKKNRKCPLCGRNLQLYYIDIEQMFLMCEDDNCDFPFGYEPIQIVYDESQLVDNPPAATPDFWEYPVSRPDGVSQLDTSTTQSSNASDCGYESNILSDESCVAKQEVLSVRLSKQSKKRKEQKELDGDIAEKLIKFKQLSKELDEMNNTNTSNREIKNKKWLSNLNRFEKTSGQTGKKFLKDAELELLKEDEPKINLEELEISIDSKATIPTIEISKKPKGD